MIEQRLSGAVFVSALLLGYICNEAIAHEPTQTHRRLTIAALELFKKNHPEQDFDLGDGLTPLLIERELALGAMEEDRCIDFDDLGLPWDNHANFYNHFWDPATNTNEGTAPSGTTSTSVDVVLLPFAEKLICSNGEFVLPDGEWVPDENWQDSNAKVRAGMLYAKAVRHHTDTLNSAEQANLDLYVSRNGLDETGERELLRQRAYRIFGRVLHLLEDMTSPAHIHNDPHGHADFVGLDREVGDCSFDIDDFETWGFCQRPDSNTNHILDYFRYQSETGVTSSLTDSSTVNSFVDCSEGLTGECSGWLETVAPYKRDYDRAKRLSDCDGVRPPLGFTCRLWDASLRLFDGKPQTVLIKDGKEGRPTAFWAADTNAGEAYVRRMAEISYDFSTFQVALKDALPIADKQPDSELNRMLRPVNTGDDDCSGLSNYGLCDDIGDFEIFGGHQEIGRTEGKCGSNDVLDITEEWWVMKHQCDDSDPPNYCSHRPDLSCPIVGPNCPVVGSRICSETHVACDLDPTNGNECPGFGNSCKDRGVCTANYRTLCAQGAIPSDCPGALNVCVDDYGNCLGGGKQTNGYAFLENIGGEGPQGTGDRDTFIPLRYGCDPGNLLCGDAGKFRWPLPESGSDKSMFKTLYGTHSNQVDILPCPGYTDSNAPCGTPRAGKTMLRIYGDVLYTNAIAYAAGLIEAFLTDKVRAEQFDVVSVADIDDNGLPEVAVVVPGGSHHVNIRDANTGDLISDINFGDDPIAAMAVIDDINGNGAPEIALLGTRPNKIVRVQVKDSLTGDTVNNIFYGSAYSAIDLTVLADTDGNGADELAVVGADENGGVRVMARDSLTDATSSITYYGDTVIPMDVLTIPDVSANGEPEVLMYGEVTATGLVRAQMRDSASRAFLRNIFFGSAYTPLELVVVDDISGDGVPDLAQLARRDDTGAVRIQVKRSDTGATISNAFTGSTDIPIAVVGIGDANGSGASDVAMLVKRPDGTAKVIVRDGATGAYIRNIFAGAVASPVSMTLIGDLNSSGSPELAILGDDGAGTRRVQIKDSISGVQVNTVDFH